MIGLEKLTRLIPALLVATLVTACGGGGGGGGGSSASTLKGTAATGSPIIGGTVTMTCASGSALTGTTGNNGAWEITLAGQTLPCAVEVSGGNLAVGVTYHALAISTGTVNITPLTDLVVASLTGQNPGTWFSGLSASSLTAIDQGMLNAAMNSVTTALGLSSALGNLNPITSTFTAQNGNVIDDILEALNSVVADYNALLAAAANNNFSGFSGIEAAFATAYANLTNGGGSITCNNGTSMTYAGNAGVYTNGQQICFTASATSLAFSGKTLTGPTQNNAVTAPFSAYTFSDPANGYEYEVIFNSGALYEINVSNGATFLGQFTPSSTSGGGGTSTLTVTVNAAGVAAGSFTINNVPAPGSQAEFCGAIQNDATFTQIGVSAGGTLTINSCSFSGNVGTISATLTITTPVSMTLPYTVTYTYN